jgi:hypothetical protein
VIKLASLVALSQPLGFGMRNLRYERTVYSNHHSPSIKTIYCIISLYLLIARDKSRIARDKSRMTRDCCLPKESILDAYACIHTCTYIYGLVALLDNIRSSFSISTLNTIVGQSKLQSQPRLTNYVIFRILTTIVGIMDAREWDELCFI